MISTRCKQGDMSIINNAIRPENKGKIVKVSEYLGYHLANDIIVLLGEHYSAFITGHYWLIESSSSSLETQYGRSMIAIQPDLWLTPITPPGSNTNESYKSQLPVPIKIST
tara:strand:- start:511 stop:843 length:333 start_codon:yes stop_codon:yes gene_type:complete